MRLVIDLQGAQSASRHRGIGRNSLALAEAMARRARDHEVWIALNTAFPDTIDPLRETFGNLVPPERIVAWDAPMPVAENNLSNEWRRKTGEILRESFLESLKPDVVHVSSLIEGFGDNAVTSIGEFATGQNTAVSFYDLIPLLQRERFTSYPARDAWYQRKLKNMQRAGLWLAVSESSRQEGIKWLGLPPERVSVMYAAADDRFRPMQFTDAEAQAIMRRYKLSRPFVLYTGATDPHKNLLALLRAYSLLDVAVRKKHQLLIVCPSEPRDTVPLIQKAKQLGLDEDDVVFARYIPDEDLIALYNLCKVFCFPSFHEGFGLPALEAMQCGTATIGSNAASIPEVIGRADALFDPHDDQDIANRLNQVLSDASYRQSLIRHGLEQARRFSWDESARLAWNALESAYGHKPARSHYGSADANHASKSEIKRPRLGLILAQFSQRNSQDGKIQSLIAALAAHYEIEVVSEQPNAENGKGLGGHPVRPLEWIDRKGLTYDRILYVIEDNSSDSKVLDLLQQHPGTVVLLETSGHHASAAPSADSPDSTLAAKLYHLYGYDALRSLIKEPNEALKAFPAGLLIAQHAQGIIASSQAHHETARQLYGEMLAEDWIVIPDGAAAQAGNPQALGERYRDAIEHFADNSRAALKTKAIAALASVHPQQKKDREWVALARSLNSNIPVLQPRRQLLVDVSELIQRDARTGVQRVTRSLLQELLGNPPAGYRVEPVYGTQKKPGYFYARDFTRKFLDLPPIDLKDEVVEISSGDVFFGLDLQHDVVLTQEDFFIVARSIGVKVYFLIHDLLPVLLPHAFDDNLPPLHARWLSALAAHADGVVCVTRTVADEYGEWLDTHGPIRARPLKIGWSHHGADIENSLPSRGLPEDAEQVLRTLKTSPSFLMVGTVEPRKGHVQAIAAFEKLWQAGHDLNLVIVGKAGWRVDSLTDQLRSHPEMGKRLFWLDGISDEYLERVYAASSCLLAASEGEGFGLPLIEAARHRIPILARDLPVFREVAGGHASYFGGNTPADLADALLRWLTLHAEGKHPTSHGMPHLSWRESAERLKAVLMEGKWYRSWPETQETTPETATERKSA